jgi:hypothetical protein
MKLLLRKSTWWAAREDELREECYAHMQRTHYAIHTNVGGSWPKSENVHGRSEANKFFHGRQWRPSALPDAHSIDLRPLSSGSLCACLCIGQVF